MTRPSSTQLADQVDGLVALLKTAKTVVPVLAGQARLERNELTGGLPTAEHGRDYSLDPAPHYSDPTGEMVVSFRPPRDGSCDPTRDLERLAEWYALVGRLVGVTRRLLNQAPAVTLAVVDGRKPTDGRSAEEHAQRRYVRAVTDEPCLIAQDHAVEDRFGPGQLRRGLCNRHRMAFARWQAEHSTWVFGLDPGTRLVRWQSTVFGTVTGSEKKQEAGGSYRNLREVA